MIDIHVVSRPKPTKVEKFAKITKRKFDISMAFDGKVNNGSRVSCSFLCSVKQKKTLNGHFILSMCSFYAKCYFFAEWSSTLKKLTIVLGIKTFLKNVSRRVCVWTFCHENMDCINQKMQFVALSDENQKKICGDRFELKCLSFNHRFILKLEPKLDLSSRGVQIFRFLQFSHITEPP